MYTLLHSLSVINDYAFILTTKTTHPSIITQKTPHPDFVASGTSLHTHNYYMQKQAMKALQDLLT